MSPRSCVISCISVTSWYSLWLSVTSDTVSGSELNALKNLSHFLFTVLSAVATELNYQVQSAGHPKTSWASKKFDAFTTIRSAGTAFWHWYHRGSLLSWSMEFNFEARWNTPEIYLELFVCCCYCFIVLFVWIVFSCFCIYLIKARPFCKNLFLCVVISCLS